MLFRMDYKTENRALKFGIGFWIVVLGALLWYEFIYPDPNVRFLIPSHWWVDWCAGSPAFTFLFERCTANMQVGSTDSLAAGMVTFVGISMLWMIQLLALSLTPVAGYALLEKRFRDE